MVIDMSNEKIHELWGVFETHFLYFKSVNRNNVKEHLEHLGYKNIGNFSYTSMFTDKERQYLIIQWDRKIIHIVKGTYDIKINKDSGKIMLEDL